MEPSIYRYIFRYSKREQLLLVVLTVISFPFLYLSLDLPKTIINKAIGGSDFPITMFGTEIDQIPYLLILCGIFLGLVFVNGGFKFYVNVFRGVVGERMLRRLRYQLVHRVLRFPLHHFRKTSQGEIVSMVTTETEPLGGFIGDALALPAFQGGTLLVIVGFVFVQDWVMGIAAIALFPVQGIIIPILQAQVNRLGKERVQNVRKLSERIGETASGAHEIHAHDTSQYELSDFSQRLGTIYGIRVNIYRKKFFIKFINNFINQLTPFFFFSMRRPVTDSGISTRFLAPTAMRPAEGRIWRASSFANSFVPALPEPTMAMCSGSCVFRLAPSTTFTPSSSSQVTLDASRATSIRFTSSGSASRRDSSNMPAGSN